jgi:RNA polymerase sigma-70 factor (ECF subfamily)
MNAESADRLLERLRRGDADAAELLLTSYEPYLRGVVRRSLSGPLRTQVDSADVVQSVWVQVVHALRAGAWQVEDGGRLRNLLARVARRRLVSRFRRCRAALERREPGGADLERLPEPRQARPSEIAQAGELWERLLALCPAEHHELLRLRRQGLAVAEVAARVGLHEGSVRRVLRGLARRLALDRAPLDAATDQAEGHS